MKWRFQSEYILKNYKMKSSIKIIYALERSMVRRKSHFYTISVVQWLFHCIARNIIMYIPLRNASDCQIPSCTIFWQADWTAFLPHNRCSGLKNGGNPIGTAYAMPDYIIQGTLPPSFRPPSTRKSHPITSGRTMTFSLHCAQNQQIQNTYICTDQSDKITQS